MASMRDIKRRKSSIQSTQQITKAMKLVATVKLQRTRKNAEQSKPYFDGMYDTMTSILGKTVGIKHPLLDPNGSDRKLVILITSNRGLAGGYDSNIVKRVLKEGFAMGELDVIALGKKGREAMIRNGANVIFSEEDVVENPNYSEAKRISEFVLERFTKGEVGEIYVAYTEFINTVVHEPTLVRLLPVQEPKKREEDQNSGAKAVMNFEPEEEEALDLIIPKYISSIIYGAIVEAAASENGARMQAMDSATSNAEEMISKLSLQYNRARQGAITQELTEIIAGAEATS
jgi:F-type H+-transporting ATPase subunit gamma